MFGESESLLSMLKNIQGVPSDILDDPQNYFAKIDVNGQSKRYDLVDTAFHLCEDTDSIQVLGTEISGGQLPGIRPKVGECQGVNVSIHAYRAYNW